MEGWSWIKRASQREKEEMIASVESWNELAPENRDMGWENHFELTRNGDVWGMTATVVWVHPECSLVEFGERCWDYAFVRCHHCKQVFILAEEDRCPICEHSWE